MTAKPTVAISIADDTGDCRNVLQRERKCHAAVAPSGRTCDVGLLRADELLKARATTSIRVVPVFVHFGIFGGKNNVACVDNQFRSRTSPSCWRRSSALSCHEISLSRKRACAVDFYLEQLFPISCPIYSTPNARIVPAKKCLPQLSLALMMQVAFHRLDQQEPLPRYREDSQCRWAAAG
jgi:hypothetical protein